MTTKWQFTSYERDAESTLDYAIFRYDNSRLGRFMTPDPIAGSISDPQSLNRYAYTRNDPVNLVDALGLLYVIWTCTASYEGTRYCEVAGIFDFPFRPFPPREPPIRGPISKRLKKLKTLILQDPDCLAFLNGKGIDPVEYLSQLLQFNLVGTDNIPPTVEENGARATVRVTNAQTPGTQVGQAITVNTAGAFFNSSFTHENRTFGLTVDRGRIKGGTEPAQLFILFHELAHGAGVLAHDAENQKQVDRNDKLLEDKCKKTVKAISGGG